MAEPPDPCPGCGARLPAADGPTHAYIGASAACWARYGELLAQAAADPARGGGQLAVDAYAVQHPGRPERRAIRSVAGHLMSLCLVLERGLDPDEAPRLLDLVLRRAPDLRWLEPPVPNGTLTVVDVLAAAPGDRAGCVELWARDVWRAWAAHAPQVRAWLDEALA